LIVLVFGLVFGCGSAHDRPPTAAARGHVTYQGQPVRGATVTFIAPGSPRFSVGTTDDAGNFELTTFAPGDGAVIGTNVVTVSKPAIAIEETTLEPNMDPKAYLETLDRAAARAIAAQRAGSALPAKYADQSTSDLREEVVDGENFFEIALVD
jgi:hypothetical protein